MYLRCDKTVIVVNLRSSERLRISNTENVSSVYHSIINLVASFLIRPQLCNLVNFLTHNLVLHRTIYLASFHSNTIYHRVRFVGAFMKAEWTL